MESFERGLIDKLTHAFQANVCDGAAILYDGFHACMN